jgi:hypothetical protein
VAAAIPPEHDQHGLVSALPTTVHAEQSETQNPFDAGTLGANAQKMPPAAQPAHDLAMQVSPQQAPPQLCALQADAASGAASTRASPASSGGETSASDCSASGPPVSITTSIEPSEASGPAGMSPLVDRLHAARRNGPPIANVPTSASQIRGRVHTSGHHRPLTRIAQGRPSQVAQAPTSILGKCRPSQRLARR